MSIKCDYCGKNILFSKYYKLDTSGEVICSSCFNMAINLKLDVPLTIDVIKQGIQNRIDETNARREASSFGLVTSKDMYYYARDNGFGRGMNEEWGLKHFKVIALNLMKDEDVLMTFIGMHNYRSATKHDKYFAYAITDKRFIIAQKNIIAGETLQTIYLDNINDITFASGMAFGIMTIDTIKEKFNVALDKISAKKITDRAHEILDEIRAKNKTLNTSQLSPADEIKKYKSLLDEGIITEEEFNTKKSQLLGL